MKSLFTQRILPHVTVDNMTTLTTRKLSRGEACGRWAIGECLRVSSVVHGLGLSLVGRGGVLIWYFWFGHVLHMVLLLEKIVAWKFMQLERYLMETHAQPLAATLM